MEKLKELFEHKMRENKINGASLVLVDKEDHYIFNHGIRDLENEVCRIENSTSFQIGSATKVFTALLALKNIKEGYLTLESLVGDFLSASEGSEDVRSISLKELLTHKSGLPRIPDNLISYLLRPENPYLFYQENEFFDYLKEAKLATKKGQQVYSNLGYGLIGFLLERVVGKPYPYLADYLLKSDLSLSHSVAFTGEIDSADNFSKGYNPAGAETPWWDMKALKSAGCITSTPSDLLKFIYTLLINDSSSLPFLSESLQSLDTKMAWGWFKRMNFPPIIKSTNNLWHNGMTGGFSSYIEIDKINQKGFALMLNKSINPGFIADLIAAEYFN